MGGGTCYDLVNAYVCFCPDRVFRSQCNGTKIPTATRPTVNQVDRKVINEPQLARTFCTPSTCENGGTCHQQGFNSMCRCKPGFTGLRCETGLSKEKEKDNADSTRTFLIVLCRIFSMSIERTFHRCAQL